ncbi:hypothetical protein HRI_000806500 [Hibiscus trionum]|uniref:Uncharacterized protein n=1 Tax=Hibiscus trionum TaxID=183268 RepID=A0A9W7LNM4_HIBTR|nr:hypothetical protein HRI_000806500 [Hibiscus trionum]
MAQELGLSSNVLSYPMVSLMLTFLSERLIVMIFIRKLQSWSDLNLKQMLYDANNCCCLLMLFRTLNISAIDFDNSTSQEFVSAYWL